MNYRYLPFHADKAIVNTDIDEQARDFARLAPLSEFSCRPGRRYRSEWVAGVANDVTVLAGSSTAHKQTQDALTDLERVSLFIPIKGSHIFQSGGQQICLEGSDSMLFYPPFDRSYETTDMSAVFIQANASAIARHAIELSSDADALVPSLVRLQEPKHLLLSDNLNRQIFSTLRQIMVLINGFNAQGPLLPSNSGIDTLIERCLTALLFPELVES
jgi:hypothetical protein